MALSWEELPKPAVIAHRGASAYEPENTLAAFKLAVRQHADAVELDAKLTADGRVVVMHDNSIDRTTNGHGLVREHTWEELSKFYSGRPEPDTHVPLLAEVLEAVAPHLMVNIELTNYATPFDNLPQKVAALVQKLGVAERVWVSSFNPVAIYRFAAAMPEIPTGLLLKQRPRLIYPLRGMIPHRAIHPHFSFVTPRRVEKWHSASKRVFVYTVNEPEEMRRLFRIGVDGIFTDDPILAQKVRSEVKASPR